MRVKGSSLNSSKKIMVKQLSVVMEELMDGQWVLWPTNDRS